MPKLPVLFPALPTALPELRAIRICIAEYRQSLRLEVAWIETELTPIKPLMEGLVHAADGLDPTE